MSIEVKNIKEPARPFLRRNDLKMGTLYKLAPPDDYPTVYTLGISGQLIWFEQGRIGVAFRDANEKFILAPEGTEVLLKA
jgi:hypothetical protein